MRHLDQRCASVKNPRAFLRLDFDARQRVRSRVVASNGEVIGLHIARGTSLRDGDCLCGDDGVVFMVRAAGEMLSVIHSKDALELTRAAYHLGNRHVRLQVDPGRLSYQADHVLDAMIAQLGFVVEQAVLPFEPVPGAYHRHGEREPGQYEAGHHHHHHSTEAHHHHIAHQAHTHHHGHLANNALAAATIVGQKTR